MSYAIDHTTERCGFFVIYGNSVQGDITGPSMCIWMVPGTCNDEA